MPEIIIAIVGPDKPGLVHKVSQVLAARGGNIEEINQTTLKGQFAGLFSVSVPADLDQALLESGLSEALSGTMSFSVFRPTSLTEPPEVEVQEPYVITLQGAPSPSLIPGITQTVASFEANIDNLRALTLSGDQETPKKVLVLEISVPKKVQQRVFRQALSLTAEELGVEISLQHRDIFESLHRL
ncbi:MAG: ACT domain-containing protein [Deltaproteobacteria bacterium]|nr:ACT domain-containing protein [Deltaproteobacteria bacterium]